MAANNQGNRTGSNRSRRSRNNNPEGHNQYNSGWMDSARERPFTAATVAAAAVGASVFLWSRRGQISEQLNNLSDQIGEWTDQMNTRSGPEGLEMAGGGNPYSSSTSTGSNEFGGSSTSTGSSGTGPSEFAGASTSSPSFGGQSGSPSFDPTTGSSGPNGRRGPSRNPASTPTGGHSTS